MEEYELTLPEIESALRESMAEVESKKEEIERQVLMNQAVSFLMGKIAPLTTENETLQEELDTANGKIDKMEQQIACLKEERDALKEQVNSANVRLNELSKMANKVAAKTEHDDLVGVLRKFMNQSRRKNIQKRIYVKMFIMEIAASSGVSLPEDMSNELKSFDDEDEKPINIDKINDIHDCGRVEIAR